MSLLLVVGGQAMAQTRGAMFLSASFPAFSDYGEFDDFGDFALTSQDCDDGGAGIGFNLGLKWYFNVGVEGLGVMLSLDGFYNGPNSDLKTAYRNQEGYVGGQYFGSGLEYNSTPKYINAPLMLGLNVSSPPWRQCANMFWLSKHKRLPPKSLTTPSPLPGRVVLALRLPKTL